MPWYFDAYFWRILFSVGGAIAIVLVWLKTNHGPFWWLAKVALFCDAVCVQLGKSAVVFATDFKIGLPEQLALLRKEIAGL